MYVSLPCALWACSNHDVSVVESDGTIPNKFLACHSGLSNIFFFVDTTFLLHVFMRNFAKGVGFMYCAVAAARIEERSLISQRIY